jgi:hypothetical protein
MMGVSSDLAGTAVMVVLRVMATNHDGDVVFGLRVHGCIPCVAVVRRFENIARRCARPSLTKAAPTKPSSHPQEKLTATSLDAGIAGD